MNPLKVIEAEYKARGSDRTPQPKVFRISSIGHQPRRLAMAKATEAFPPEPIQGRGQRTFEVGKQRQEALRAMLLKAGVAGHIPASEAAEEEVRIKLDNGWSVVGHPDGDFPVVEVKGVAYERVLLEIKTAGAAGWRDVVKGVVDDLYIAQASMYCEAKGLDWIYFLFERKDTQALAEVIMPKSKEAVERALFNVQIAATSIDQGMDPLKLPACQGDDYGYKHRRNGLSLGWKCSYCPFVGYCFPTHVRVLMGGKQVCIEEIAVGMGEAVLSYGVGVIPRSDWKMIRESGEEVEV